MRETEKHRSPRKKEKERGGQPHDLYKSLFLQATDGIIIFSQGRILDANPAFCAMYGDRKSEIMGKSPTDFIHPDERDIAISRIQSLFSDDPLPVTQVYRAMRADGTLGWIEVLSKKIEWAGHPALQSIVRDITDKKKGEMRQAILYKIVEAATEPLGFDEFFGYLQHELAYMLDTSNFFVALADPSSPLLTFPFCAGGSASEGPALSSRPLGRGLLEFVMRERAPLLVDSEQIERMAYEGKIDLHAACPAMWLGVPLETKGNVIGVMGVQSFTDPRAFSADDLDFLRLVSGQVASSLEKKKAEEALRASEARYRTLFEGAGDAIFIHDAAGKILAANRVALQRLGYGRDELSKKNLSEVSIPESSPRSYTTSPESGVIIFESRQITKGGTVIPTEVSSHAVEYGGERAILSIARDITERKNFQKKLEAIHAMAQELALNLDPDAIARTVLDVAKNTLRFDNCALSLIDEDSQETYIKAAMGYPSAYNMKRQPLTDRCVVNWVAMHKESALIRDVREDERYEEWMPNMRSELCVPIVFRQKVLGTLNVESSSVDAFDWEDRMLLETLASGTAVALQNALLHKEKEKRIEETASLNAAFQAIESRMNLQERLRLIVEYASSLIGTHGGTLYLYDRERNELEMVVSHNLDHDYAGVRLLPGEGLSGKVLLSRKPLSISDYQGWEGKSDKFHARNIRSVLGVPIVWANEVIGVINVIEDGAKRRFTDHETSLLENFSNTAAAMVVNARLFEEIKGNLEEISTIYAAGSAISSILDLKPLLKAIITVAQKNFSYKTVTLFLADEAAGELAIAEAVGLDEGSRALRFRIGKDGIVGRVASEGISQFWGDVSRCPYYIRGKSATRSEIAVPLRIKEKVAGVLDVQSDLPDGLRQRDLRIVEALALQISNALENARLYERIQASNIQLEFISDLMSHDLSNINQIVLGNIEMLSYSGASDTQMRFITAAKSAVRRSARLAANVKILKAMLAGKEEKKEVRLADVLARAIDEVEDCPGVSPVILFDPSFDCLVSADPHLERAFGNLLDNAIKFSEGGNVRVAVDVERLEGRILVRVTDWGRGISDDMKRDIFRRLEMLQEGVLGTGLGLYTAKKIVENHSGRIWVEDNPEGGSVFCVEIPEVGA